MDELAKGRSRFFHKLKHLADHFYQGVVELDTEGREVVIRLEEMGRYQRLG